MAAYPKSAAQEQIVVPLKSVPGAAFAARRSAEQPRASIPEVSVEACLGFAESRRTGNIEVTFHSPSPSLRQPPVPGQDEPPPVLKAAPIALHARPRPHAAMPVPQGDFRGDLLQVDAEAPAATEAAAIETLMADLPKEPSGESSCHDAKAVLLRNGMDVRLAQIVEAWPRLPPRTREALAAALDSPQSLDHRGTAVPNRRRKRAKQ